MTQRIEDCPLFTDRAQSKAHKLMFLVERRIRIIPGRHSIRIAPAPIAALNADFASPEITYNLLGSLLRSALR